MEEETMNHFIGPCLKWAKQRGGYLNSFYLSVSETVDTVPLHQIITVETHTYPPLNFTGVSTELNLSHMVPSLRLLGGTGFYLTVVLWTTAPYEEEKESCSRRLRLIFKFGLLIWGQAKARAYV